MINLSEKVLECLKNSQYWTSHTRVSGKTIQGLVCPVCGDKSAWAYAPGASSGPMAVCCNRKNSCGTITKTIELLNIKFDIEKEYPATKQDSHRPARAYLENRGIKNALKGLEFEYWPKIRKTSSGAVMFPVQSQGGDKTLYNGRLINPKSGQGKTHNSGSTTGAFWKHPGLEYDTAKNTYITEGIIDALSLLELGYQAIAILAAGQDPTKVSLPPLGKLVFCLDPDLAGAAATRKWLSAYPDAEAIMMDKGGDCNDLLRSSDLGQVKAIFKTSYERYQLNAQLALAESAWQYANLYHGFHNKVPGIFAFNGWTYLSYTKRKNDEQMVHVERICKATIEVISFLRDNSNPDQPEFSLLLKIKPVGKPAIETVADSRDLATPKGLREFTLARAGIAFEGGTQAATAIVTYLTSANVPEVSQLNLTGYCPCSGWYFFKHFAVDTQGAIHNPDKQGLYKINHMAWCRSAVHSADKAISPAEKMNGVESIHKFITGGWKEKGAAAFAWMVSSWFVNSIKQDLNWFPFLSLYGSPSSGKSALTTILNNMQGRDTEGLPMTSLNSKKGLARSISRVSGLFTALLEDNRRDQSNFDYSVILTGYNSGPLQIQAAYSGDSRTVESPFLGSLLFVQNTEPFTTQAERERVISFHFDNDQLTDETRTSYEQLMKISKQQLAGVIVQVLQRRMEIEKGWFKEYTRAIDDMAGVDNRRILQNHALLLCFHRIICRLFKIEYHLDSFILETAKKKVISSAQREYSQGDRFFEALTHLEDDKITSCAHFDTDKGRVYVNLPGIEEQLRNAGINLWANDALTQALARHPAFVENGKVFRFPEDQQLGADLRPKARRVWVFDSSKI